jgi:hypothetical protein
LSGSSQSLRVGRKLNDHRLKDGGFVDRLKPTKVIREKTNFYWLMTCGHIADFSSPKGEGFQPSPMGTLITEEINQKITARLLFGNLGIRRRMELVEKGRSRKDGCKYTPLTMVACGSDVTAVCPGDCQGQAETQTDTGL